MSELYKDDDIDFNKYIEGADEEYEEMLTEILKDLEEMDGEEFQGEEDLKDVIEDLSKGDIIDMMEDLKIPVQTYITDVTDKENLELKDLSVDDLKSISKALFSGLKFLFF